ncbi:MAG: threonine/serine exporter family protein [Treponema sp.]
MSLYIHFILSFISCLGFGVLFNVQKENLVLSAVGGAVGWTMVIMLQKPHISYIFANFLAGLTVGILSEIFAIVRKTPATVFMVIGIIPLVPGFGVYKAMLFFVSGNIESGVAEGIHASFIAVALAVGIILATSSTRLVRKGLIGLRYRLQHRC